MKKIRTMTKRELAVRKVEETFDVSLEAAQWIVEMAEGIYSNGARRSATGAVRLAYETWARGAGPR